VDYFSSHNVDLKLEARNPSDKLLLLENSYYVDLKLEARNPSDKLLLLENSYYK
jgi:hypothetical protein